MTQQLLTRCPNCETLFKLYPRQIEAAGGFVRCGACMKIFKAHKHILDPLELPTVAEISIPIESSHLVANISDWREALTEDINKIYQNLEAELNEQLTANNPQAVPTSSSQTSLPKPTPLAAVDISATTSSTSTSPATPSTIPKKSRLPKFTDDISDSFKNLASFNNTAHHSGKAPNLITGKVPNLIGPTPIEASDESWAEKILSELGDFNEEINSSENSASSAPENPSTGSSHLYEQNASAPKSSEVLQLQTDSSSDSGLLNAALADNLIQELSHHKPNRSFIDEHPLIHDIDEENRYDIETPDQDTYETLPLEIELPKNTKLSAKSAATIAKQPKPTWSNDNKTITPKATSNNLDPVSFDSSQPPLTADPDRLNSLPLLTQEEDDYFKPNNQPIFHVGYALGCLFLIALGLAQHAYFHFSTLNQNENLRPFYVIGCQLLNCVVPPRQDIDKIVNQNIVVQQHPTVKNALRANILIKNEAEFAQPFPQLRLTFTDLNQQKVAQRLFTPDEYQKDDLRNLVLMPAQQSIRLMFDFWDPGPSAVSSELTVCHTQNQKLRCKN